MSLTKLFTCKRGLKHTTLTFVYSVKHVKGNVHPVFNLMTDQQIIDLKRFCGTVRTVLGVDKIYNLGDFFVTPAVFKDLSVLRRSTKQHSITVGPTCIHTNSSGRTYSSFVHDISCRQPDGTGNQEIYDRVGRRKAEGGD